MNTQSLVYLLGGVVGTLVITGAAFAIGAVLGAPVAWAQRSRFFPVRALIRTYVEIIRAVPPLVWIFVVFFGLPEVGVSLQPLTAAIVTLGVIASSYLAEIYRGGLAAIHRGQWEACAALGMSGLDTARHVVAPQVLRVILPTAATYLIGLLKDSALASAIGVAEIAFRANAETQRTGLGLTFFVAAGVLYVLLSLPLAAMSRRLDSRIRARYAMT
ncbi:amino acid ABC transporter permease [Planosporangium flavigriseum]|uniref:ABC transmembrane type-1 domain-containing protein n=1 Tax=Planosporangium flavigriseum TaxID=373681 RepID=A0A8J3PM81_9ACTN|nr:amino acid ABC transporter permease [Planosporangium flavigriseum]NJC65754.1 amino acid ABC transporter permease [Planosporangium flavigriseum]GIG73608.1 hypothetical protein Pfl04_20120 [Planosporangium flavigriseum]